MKTSSKRQRVRHDDLLSQAAYSDRVTPPVTADEMLKIVDEMKAHMSETQKAVDEAKARARYALWLEEPDYAAQAQQQAMIQQILNSYAIPSSAIAALPMALSMGYSPYSMELASPPQEEEEEGKTEVERLAATITKALRPQRRNR